MRNQAGDFLKFLIMEEEISAYVAAEHTGLSLDQIGDIIAGRQRITPDIAALLSKMSGTTAEMWLRLGGTAVG
ncbi:MAG: hypothetical protein ABIR70_12880 [Bryobacteraceae bacterium]